MEEETKKEEDTQEEETKEETSTQEEETKVEDTQEEKTENNDSTENNNPRNIKTELVDNAKKSSKKLFYTIFIIALIAIVIFYKQGITGNVINIDNTNVINNVNDIASIPTTQSIQNMEQTTILLETTEGDITIELYEDMPITAGNFKSLVESKTYDGVIFHRIIDGFMIQGGDPTGTGMGDPKIPNIKDEFTNTKLDKNNRGTIAMANAGPNTGSSQFFINLVNNNFLDGKHPVFGKVIDGMDVVDKMAKVQTGPGDKPTTEVKIISAKVI